MKIQIFLACLCVVFLESVSGQENTTDICSLPDESGNCRARFTRYYYNSTTTHCEEFIYGGCGGNQNNFETIFECRKRCGQTMPSDTDGVVIPMM